ncbi:sodium/calcium exchanger regulatory protein 1-like [Gigantopelta aegis]|uniref:sodium/calcium exchanger regulatory protein 1-like n=1 Tax=Gigantopelta aegis TaxID=1735272 RepID=UPI001B889821|nr:sodium/calcium exchanger regulatory protein 1-like [Gigantopelta aegis]
MAHFNGKWELYSSEQFEEYMAAIGVSPENIKKATVALSASSKLVQQISVSGEDWTIKVVTNSGEKAINFKLGEEFSTSTLDGRPVKATLNLEGDKLVEIHKGDGFETKSIRTVSGGEMTMVLSGNGVTCTRKYKKVD